MTQTTLWTRLSLGTSLLALGLAAQAAYPDKPITFIVPTAAAGGTDTIARIFADALGKELKATVIIDNKPGANGIVGVDAGARAAPDGYHLLFTYAASMVANPFLFKKLPFDPVKDFEPVVQLGQGGNLLLVNNNLPVKTVKEFVAYVKAHPNKVSYCSWGTGSGGHLAMENLMKQTGMKMTHVPYKGSAPCVQDLVGGQVQAAFADTSSTLPMIKAGRLRVLAHSGDKRYPQIPDVQSLNELGYPFKAYAWYGLLAPAKTPRPIVDQLNQAMNKVMADPEVRKRLYELNLADLPPSSPAQFAATIQQDLKTWGDLVTSLDIPKQ
ncbi:ABC transporter substrate-binding protein [Comamonas serinivorans]|uniref:ABC transporter substrate-binding protein n=1 Tax=Comamonas serinivorans TaxID=1082851 RepID=A0A1Y0EL31_9BURK|nr:tripartite tricarboxylate transporter substrate binding protein [Comamonas serinivorans]ARU04276.1 ABC transporter substrate-binding protein [Comamonas serinivorans]